MITRGNFTKDLLTCKPTTTTPDTTTTPIMVFVNLLGRRASIFSGSALREALDGKWCPFAVEFQFCAILDVLFCYSGTLLRMIWLPAGPLADNTPVISKRVWSSHMTVQWISCTDNHRSTCQTSHLGPMGVTMARWSFCWHHIFYSINYPPFVLDKAKYKIFVSFISPSFGQWCHKSQQFYGLHAL